MLLDTLDAEPEHHIRCYNTVIYPFSNKTIAENPAVAELETDETDKEQKGGKCDMPRKVEIDNGKVVRRGVVKPSEKSKRRRTTKNGYNPNVILDWTQFGAHTKCRI